MGVPHCKARYAALKRHRGAEDPATVEAARDLAAEHIEQTIKRIVDAAPPLSEAQRSRLRQIFTSARRDASEVSGGAA